MTLPNQSAAFIGSRICLPGNIASVYAVNPNDIIDVSIYLKPKVNNTDDSLGRHISRTSRDIIRNHRALEHKYDIELISNFAVTHGLKVIGISPQQRLVRLSGDLLHMQNAFNVSLLQYNIADDINFRAHSDYIHLPNSISNIVDAVLGLDTLPAAITNSLVTRINPSVAKTAYKPSDVAGFYNFPQRGIGSGQCIALLELGGGYLDSDNSSAFSAMGLPTPKITTVSVNGAANSPGGPHDTEVALDIQVAGGAAPGSHLVAYFAPNTFQGFVDALSTAVHDNDNAPSVISISWGAPETTWTQQARHAVNAILHDAAMLGISVFVAAGDHLATGGLSNGRANVSFPASSPFAIGCGGTQIETLNGRIIKEIVWNEGQNGWGTGGGISDLEPLPEFQRAYNIPPNLNDGHHRRGVPDVAGNASSLSGYSIIVRGAVKSVGGTSAVAPLWAGLAARINESSKDTIGFFLPYLYNNAYLMTPITRGNNITTSSSIGYQATEGWNACTGLGSPNGEKLLLFFSNLKSHIIHKSL